MIFQDVAKHTNTAHTFRGRPLVAGAVACGGVAGAVAAARVVRAARALQRAAWPGPARGTDADAGEVGVGSGGGTTPPPRNSVVEWCH